MLSIMMQKYDAEMMRDTLLQCHKKKSEKHMLHTIQFRDIKQTYSMRVTRQTTHDINTVCTNMMSLHRRVLVVAGLCPCSRDCCKIAATARCHLNFNAIRARPRCSDPHTLGCSSLQSPSDALQCAHGKSNPLDNVFEAMASTS